VSGLPANRTRDLGDADAIARSVPDGALVALPPDYSLPAMDVIRALIRKASDGDVAAAKELLDRILGKPTTVIEGDLNLTSDSTLADRLQRATDRVVQLQRDRLESNGGS